MTTAAWTALVAIALYLTATALMARQLRGGAGDSRPTPMLWLGGLAVLCHGIALWQRMITPEGIQLGFFPVASLVGALGAALVVLTCLRRPLAWIGLMVFPLSALTLPPALWIQAGEAARPLDYGLGAHVLLSVTAHAVFGVAAAHSVLLLIQHRQLKDGHIRGVMRLFPPIQVMEAMLFELLWLGVVLLAGGIVAGFAYVEDLFAQHLVHKTVLSLVALGVFSILLAGHHLFGWRARTAIRMTIAGFVLLVLAFFGSQLVLEYILERTG